MFTPNIFTLLATLLAALFSFAAPGGAPAGVAPAPSGKTVRVYSEREGDVTRFFVENNEYCEITVSFEMKLRNLKSSVPLPHVAAFPARQTTEAFTVQPETPGLHWEYSYTNYYKLGSHLAQHDDSFVYQLPYSPGRKFVVTQAYNGTFSHRGANQYAIDWKMPEGTLVHAARGGVVVKAKENSNRGGPAMEYDRYNNFVLIRHDDGTLAHYCHLRKNGVLVKIGQRVETGQPIARSGNTGFSSGPHLHFCIFKTKSGRARVSIPVRFRTTEHAAVVLREDQRYRASGVVSTTLAGAPPAEVSQGASNIQ